MVWCSSTSNGAGYHIVIILLFPFLSAGRPSVGHTGRRWGKPRGASAARLVGRRIDGESAKLTRRLDLPRVQAAAKARDAPLTSGPQAVNNTNWPETSRPAAPARPIRASAGERIAPAEEADLCRGVPGNHDAAGESRPPARHIEGRVQEAAAGERAYEAAHCTRSHFLRCATGCGWVGSLSTLPLYCLTWLQPKWQPCTCNYNGIRTHACPILAQRMSIVVTRA